MLIVLIVVVVAAAISAAVMGPSFGVFGVGNFPRKRRHVKKPTDSG